MALQPAPACSHLIGMPYERDKHQDKKKDREGRNSKEGDPFTAPVAAHGSSQAFSHQVHAGHHEKGHKEGEGQTEDDGPGQRLPENSVVPAEIDVRIEIRKQRDEIDVETDCQGNEGEDSSQSGQQYRNDAGLPGFYGGFPRLHPATPELIGELDHKDPVLDDDTGEAHDTEP